MKKDIFMHIPYNLVLLELEEIRRLGINCEIYIDGESLDSYKEDDIVRINNVFEQYELKKIVHGPIYDLNPGSLDPKIRRISQERILQTISFCERLKTNHIVFHHGFHHIYYRGHRKRWLDNAYEIWGPINEYCLNKNIVIAIENSFDPEPGIILDLIEKINSSNFKACFDIGHFNVFGNSSPLEIFNKYPIEVIDEIHLSDNLGDFDSHLALGAGNIDFAGFLKLLMEKQISPIITIEPHSLRDAQVSFAYLSKILNVLK